MSLLDRIFPDFWRTSFAEPGVLDVIEKALGLAYESAYHEIDEAEKNLSIKTALPWHEELYPTVQCTYDNVYDPGIVDGYKRFHKIKTLTFEYKNLRLGDGTPVPHSIFFDADTQQFFIGTNLESDNVILFADSSLEAWTDHSFGFFFDRSAIDYNPIAWAKVSNLGVKSNVYIVPNLRPDLTRRLAQYANMVYASVNAPALSFVESLFSVAFGGDFFVEDGKIVSVGQNDISVHGESGLRTYIGKPRAKFVAGGTVEKYEAVSDSPVKLYSWFTTPARFTQMLIADSAKMMMEELFRSKFRTLSAIEGLRHSSEVSFDMGGLPTKADLYGYGKSRGRAHGGNPEYIYEWWLDRKEMIITGDDPQDGRLGVYGPVIPSQTKLYQKHRFEQYPFHFPHPSVGVEQKAMFWWRDVRFPDYLYESMKGLIIWETEINKKWHGWISDILQKFKPLNLKFKKSPRSGIVKHQKGGRGLGTGWRPEVGYGKKRGKAMSSKKPPVADSIYAFKAKFLGVATDLPHGSPVLWKIQFYNATATPIADRDVFYFEARDGETNSPSLEMPWSSAAAGGSFIIYSPRPTTMVLFGRKTNETDFTMLAEAPVEFPLVYSFSTQDYSRWDGSTTVSMVYQNLQCSDSPDMDVFQFRAYGQSGTLAGEMPPCSWSALFVDQGSYGGSFNVDANIIGYGPVVIKLFGKKTSDQDYALLATATSSNVPV